MKKYEFTGETRIYKDVEVKQIRRISDDLIGGWIQSELNLSHDNEAFIYKDAIVYGNAIVYGDARVYGNAIVYGDARVYGNTKVCEDATVFGDATVCENTEVFGNAMVYGDARVYGNTMVYGNAKVLQNARVYGNTEVCGDAIVRGNAEIHGDARVYGNAEIHGDAIVQDCNIGIGRVQTCFDTVEFYTSNTSRVVTAITKNNQTLFNVGCQELITKGEFIKRIEETNGGIKQNPHREFYLKVLSLY